LLHALNAMTIRSPVCKSSEPDYRIRDFWTSETARSVKQGFSDRDRYAVCRQLKSLTALLSLRLIRRRMRQWPFVLEHLAEVTQSIHPPQAGQRMKCSVSSLGASPRRLPMYLPGGISVTVAASLAVQ
jgi:hypothetical protein